MPKKYEMEKCLKCGADVEEQEEACKCGSKNFAFGDNLKYDDGKIICGCGNDEFEMTFHMNANPWYTKNYKCTNPECGNILGTKIYHESRYY